VTIFLYHHNNTLYVKWQFIATMSSTNDDITSQAQLPSPLDDPTCIDPLSCPSLNWGFIGCGRVSHDYIQSLKHLPTQNVVACATSNSLERAQQFAKKHSILKSYGTYEELLADETVQIVYVGNIHSFRRTIVEQCINANKHILVEKPFACTVDDAEYLINLARSKGNLFMLEGMWTRFFPAVEKARQLCADSKDLGEIVNVSSDFNFNASDSEEYPTSFFYNRKLGGGATLLVAPYPIAAASKYEISSNIGNVTCSFGLHSALTPILNTIILTQIFFSA
jgi:dihydrodiol dehydrogenase / D-xylose 1-dehydrogenase (NADP)